jgi:hypothetical protein
MPSISNARPSASKSVTETLHLHLQPGTVEPRVNLLLKQRHSQVKLCNIGLMADATGTSCLACRCFRSCDFSDMYYLTAYSDPNRRLIPICSGQIWPFVGIRDRIVGIGDPVVGIPRFSLLKQWTTLSPDNPSSGDVSPWQD